MTVQRITKTGLVIENRWLHLRDWHYYNLQHLLVFPTIALSREVTPTRVFQKWKDEKLTWKPEDYNGVQRVWVDAHKVWKPDIMVYN